MFIPEEYTSFSDTELLRLTQQGNYDALLTLLTNYMPLVKARSNAYVQNPLEFEDFFQEGMVALFNAIRSFKSESNTFPAYAKTCVDNALISHLRSLQKKSSIPAEKTVSLDDFLHSASSEADPQDILLAKEAVENRKNVIESNLSKLEYEILSRFLNGESYSNIAKHLNITEKSVDNAIQRVRRKIKSI